MFYNKKGYHRVAFLIFLKEANYLAAAYFAETSAQLITLKNALI